MLRSRIRKDLVHYINFTIWNRTGGPSDGDASIFFFDIDYMQLHHSNMHLVILMEIEFVFLYVLYSRCFYVCMKHVFHTKKAVLKCKS